MSFKVLLTLHKIKHGERPMFVINEEMVSHSGVHPHCPGHNHVYRVTSGHREAGRIRPSPHAAHAGLQDSLKCRREPGAAGGDGRGRWLCMELYLQTFTLRMTQ
jgi:hypothetical protein